MTLQSLGGGVDSHAELADLSDNNDDHAQYVLITRDGSGRIVYNYGLSVPAAPASGSLWLEAS